jgi:hypothetical protein
MCSTSAKEKESSTLPVLCARVGRGQGEESGPQERWSPLALRAGPGPSASSLNTIPEVISRK